MTSQLARAIPLQGALTCRVLDQLLDEPFPRVDAASDTSAGAMTAAFRLPNAACW